MHNTRFSVITSYIILSVLATITFGFAWYANQAYEQISILESASAESVFEDYDQ